MIREKKKFPKYLALIRLCPCLICGNIPCEAAHIRFSSAKYGKVNSGVGSKPHDKFTVPLCAYHHRLGPKAQHSMGESQFWELHAVEPLELALALWGERDNLPQMQRIAYGTYQFTLDSRKNRGTSPAYRK